MIAELCTEVIYFHYKRSDRSACVLFYFPSSKCGFSYSLWQVDKLPVLIKVLRVDGSATDICRPSTNCAANNNLDPLAIHCIRNNVLYK